jgi:hypothetical protein
MLGFTLWLRGVSPPQTSKHAFGNSSTHVLLLIIPSIFIRYGHSLVHLDPKAEAKLRLKIDLMIVPTVALLYLFCFIDRANIGEMTHSVMHSQAPAS